MRLCSGEMWDAWPSADLFLFTGNSTITRAGKLVMGRGMAKDVLRRFPEVDKALAKAILRDGERTIRGMEYGLLVSPNWPKSKLGVLQVKYNWQDSADLYLITQSLIALVVWVSEHPTAEVHCNFPGIGNGRLDPQRVYDTAWGLLHDVPNVTLWTRDPLKIEERDPIR